MTKPILEVHSVSKQFKIYHERQSYLSLRDRIMSAFGGQGAAREDFMALDNINFSLHEGDTLGIIGKNGAGKSTLLKILSRITPPSKGHIITRGRIASLLEVGTGFHPELSGRENIFLNGSILGMRKNEIRRQFDEIVDFSGVEKFLDTPLKHYSSGMQLRLAFAVAAFLEPEILIIDEVLAVGDMEFQRKCLRQMENVSQSGRTILFVSHNMAAVRKLCQKGLLLQKGKLEMVGGIDEVIERYTADYSDEQCEFSIPHTVSAGQGGFAYKLRIEDLDSRPRNGFPLGAPWRIRISIKVIEKIGGFVLGLGITSSDDIGVRTAWTEPSDILPGNYEFTFEEKTLILAEGNYKLIVGLSSRSQTFQYAENCAQLRISHEIDPSLSTLRVTRGAGMVLNPMRMAMEKV